MCGKVASGHHSHFPAAKLLSDDFAVIRIFQFFYAPVRFEISVFAIGAFERVLSTGGHPHFAVLKSDAMPVRTGMSDVFPHHADIVLLLMKNSHNVYDAGLFIGQAKDQVSFMSEIPILHTPQNMILWQRTLLRQLGKTAAAFTKLR